MFRDIGFILEVIKDFGKILAFGFYFASCFLMHTTPAPYNYLFMAYALFGLMYWFVPLTKEVLEDKYKRYRARKEEAWNVLKETK